MIRFFRRLVVLTLILVALGYVSINIFSPNILPHPQQIVQMLRESGPWGILVFIALSFLRALILFPPNVVLTISSGLVFGPVYGIIFGMIGALVCAIVQFAIARFFGRPVVEELVEKQNLLPDTSLFTSVPSVILVRLLIVGVPFDLVNYALGFTKARWRDYVIGTAIGLLPGTIFYTWFGYALDQPASFLPLVFGGAITSIAAIVLAWRYKNSRKSN